jgi:hypothetical protein
MKSRSFSVSTTRVKIIAADNITRQVYLHAVGNGVVYVGGADVTADNGMLTEKHAVPFEMQLPSNQELWAITASGTQDMRVMTPDED